MRKKAEMPLCRVPCALHGSETLIPVERLEHALRDHLNATAPRALVVLHPLKVRHKSQVTSVKSHIASVRSLKAASSGCSRRSLRRCHCAPGRWFPWILPRCHCAHAGGSDRSFVVVNVRVQVLLSNVEEELEAIPCMYYHGLRCHYASAGVADRSSGGVTVRMQVVLTNVQEGAVEELEAKRWPDAKEGDPETNYKVRPMETL